MEAGDRLRAAYDAVARHAWSEAVEQFKVADAAKLLGARDFEEFGEAAEWSYQDDVAREVYARAFAAYQAEGLRRDAARVALHVAHIHKYRKEDSLSSAWTRRAEQILADLPECGEHGRLHWLFSMRASGQGKTDAALEHAERAIEIAKRENDPDVLSLGLLRKARVMLKLGRADEARVLVDDAMVAAVAGELRLSTAGVVYCAAIDVSTDLFDFDRAGEWTDATEKWLERTSVGLFPGVCRVHRAEILRRRGRWQEAHREVLRASDELQQLRIHNVLPSAFYELGEILMRMGNHDGAADAFRKAHELGMDPLPGLALLWLEQGRAQAAASLLTKALADIALDDRLRRARILPAQVEISIAIGDLAAASTAADELDAAAHDYSTPALEAYSHGARGALLLARDDVAGAVARLRRGVQMWTQLDAPYDAARLRVQLARAYRREGNTASADLELNAARSAFERLGAVHSLRMTAPAEAAPLSETLEATPADRAKLASVGAGVGDVIDGKLELLRLIGGGGMGRVFEAKNRRTGRHVAVKVLRLDTCSDKAACERLLQEALACGRIQHANVVDVYDAGMCGTQPYIMMELLRGESLATRIERERVLPIGDAIEIVLQALEGLASAHRAGIVHRDLKPDNLFLADVGGSRVVKVVDFGISKLVGDAALSDTKTGTIVGTPYYMSPEQAQGSKRIDERTDIYAIGAVLFHAIAGRPPFLGDNYNALLAAILTTSAPSVRSLRAEAPAAVDAAIARALSRDPAGRHRSADELAAELRAAQH